MFHPNSIQNDRISEEALGDFLSSSIQTNEDILNHNPNIMDMDISGICDIDDLLTSMINPTVLNELDQYVLPSICQVPDLSSQDDNLSMLINNPIMLQLDTPQKTDSQSKQIPLSSSVGVGQPVITAEHPYKVHIVHPLEEFYRARYKSDYVTHSGKMRKPRYVADRLNNHYVTLKVPSTVRGMIRVDWLTIPNECGLRYWMPYRLQQNHKIDNEPDKNPIYVPIDIDKSGYMKLKLVLIKSKQDELKSCLPLKPFQPYHDVFGKLEKNNSQSEFIRTPKQVIQAYHLEQSQLAFTFCTISSDGKACIPQWDTTDYSTTLTETPAESTKRRKLTCPKCAHSFTLSSNGDSYTSDHEIVNSQQILKQTSTKRQVKRMTNINKIRTQLVSAQPL